MTTHKFIHSLFFRDTVTSQGLVLFKVVLCWHFWCDLTLSLFTCCCHGNSVCSISLIFSTVCILSCCKNHHSELSLSLSLSAGKLETLLHPFFGKWQVSSEERGEKKSGTHLWEIKDASITAKSVLFIIQVSLASRKFYKNKILEISTVFKAQNVIILDVVD